MPRQDGFPAVFERLRDVLRAYEGRMVLQADGPTDYYLNTPYSAAYKKELMFGAVQVKKSYVSYHLFPVYMYPDLLDGVSPALRARMQGKSCFNFSALDDAQLRELEALTARGAERMRREGVLPA